jgi:hypothetical protein
MPGRPTKPPVSQAQRRLFYAAKAGDVPGISKAVGAEKVEAGHGVTDLPTRVKKKKKAKPGVAAGAGA